MQEEKWKPVIGYEGYYEVSDKGRVRSLDRIVDTGMGFVSRRKGRVLKAANTAAARGAVCLSVALCVDRERENALVHRLVYEAFVGPLDDTCLVLHRDGDGSNNTPSNLVKADWVCFGKHKIQIGAAPSGEKNGNAFFSQSAVASILASKKTYTEIAREYGVTRSAIAHIKKRRSWKHIGAAA